ncbi:hypothetical protein M231_08012 [Tremella mesenterica]|uniref:Transcriptional coactivator p15 (PC4) C-terminal domain-containing protein n=1 Tax=Tremella mesenterica TaxID=5217 RepID=A0A4Q1BDA7_TREME|nr:hypothetical protein M231_08012 [Tremella mesenterica]
MVKQKRAPVSESEEGSAVSSEEEVKKPIKKVKKEIKEKSKSKTDEKTAEGIQHGDKGQPFLALSDYRRVSISKFQDKTLIDIREYYKDKGSGEMKPGKKGISLTCEQWESLKGNINSIDQMLSEQA